MKIVLYVLIICAVARATFFDPPQRLLNVCQTDRHTIEEKVKDFFADKIIAVESLIFGGQQHLKRVGLKYLSSFAHFNTLHKLEIYNDKVQSMHKGMVNPFNTIISLTPKACEENIKIKIKELRNLFESVSCVLNQVFLDASALGFPDATLTSPTVLCASKYLSEKNQEKLRKMSPQAIGGMSGLIVQAYKVM